MPGRHIKIHSLFDCGKNFKIPIENNNILKKNVMDKSESTWAENHSFVIIFTPGIYWDNR